MEIPHPTPFDVYIGTLVINKILGEPIVLVCPFVVVMLHPSSREPMCFMSNSDSFENAAIDMDDIQYEGMRNYSNNPTEYTVLEIGYKGDTVVWDDRIPMVPVG